jgi:SAM-dependent methyltransferase
MKPPAFIRRRAREILLKTLPSYGYALVYVKDRNPLLVGNMFQDGLITCNFCGTIFKRTEPNHSESLACPQCDAIARERVAYQCILNELTRRSGEVHLYFRGATHLGTMSLLECSPRTNPDRLAIYEKTLKKYAASDFDMSIHRTSLKIDLTVDQDVDPFADSFDIIICSHVLEHIPDYHKALKSLNKMLAPDGFLVLQVPLLESQYTQVTWEEFHQDNTRVYHRFGFDLLFDLERYFRSAYAVVGQLDFEVTSPEIKPDKYEFLKKNYEHCIILGEDSLVHNGFGNPDLCDAFIAYKQAITVS